MALPENGARATLPAAYGDDNYRAVLSPDGRILATTNNDDVLLWDIPTGGLLRTITLGGRSVGDVTFGPDGHSIAIVGHPPDDESGLPSAYFCFDPYSDRKLVQDALAVRFAAGGRTIVAEFGAATGDVGDDWVQVWDVVAGTMISSLPSRSTGEGELARLRARDGLDDDEALSPSTTRVIVADRGGSALLVDAESGQAVTTLRGEDGKAVAVGRGEDENLLAARLSPDGQHISAIGDAGVQIWDAGTGRFVGTFPAASTDEVAVDVAARRVLVTGGGKRTVAEDDDTVWIIDYDTGRPIGSWVNPAGFTAPSFSRDGRVALATSTTDDELWMWDMPSGRLRSTLAQTSLAALGTETSDAGYLLTRRADDSYLLSDTTGIPLVTLGPAGDEELDLGSALHQPTSGPIGRNSTSTGPIGGGPVLLDPRARLLATTLPYPPAADTELHLIEVATGRLLAAIPAESLSPASSGFSADGAAFLAAYSDHITIWDTTTGRPRSELIGTSLTGSDDLDSDRSTPAAGEPQLHHARPARGRRRVGERLGPADRAPPRFAGGTRRPDHRPALQQRQPHDHHDQRSGLHRPTLGHPQSGRRRTSLIGLLTTPEHAHMIPRRGERPRTEVRAEVGCPRLLALGRGPGPSSLAGALQHTGNGTGRPARHAERAPAPLASRSLRARPAPRRSTTRPYLPAVLFALAVLVLRWSIARRSAPTVSICSRVNSGRCAHTARHLRSRTRSASEKYGSSNSSPSGSSVPALPGSSAAVDHLPPAHLGGWRPVPDSLARASANRRRTRERHD